MPYCHPSVLAVQARLMWRNDPTSSSLRLVCLQIQFVQLSSRSIKLCRPGVQTTLAMCQLELCRPSHRQSHAEPEMLTIIISSLLPIFLLSQERSLDEELLLHPDLVEDDFSPRQSNSTAATTSSLAFGIVAVLLVSSKISHRAQDSF